MGLLDLFSKLITEHGSAEVQGKHIALFRDQLALADKKTAQLESEVAELKGRIEKTEADLQASQNLNESLRSKILEHEHPAQDASIEEIKVDILRYLYKCPKTSTPFIAQALKIGLPIAEFHIKELLSKGMVKRVVSGSALKPEGGWSLYHEGTRYLIEHSLV